jgi:hypothetical protein
MRAVAPLLLVAAIVSGCAEHGKVYTQSDVKRSFRSQGLELTTPFLQPAADARVTALVPKSGQFVVLVYESEKRANEAERAFQATTRPLDLQDGNVIVTSNKDIAPPVRQEIRDALAALSSG